MVAERRLHLLEGRKFRIGHLPAAFRRGVDEVKAAEIGIGFELSRHHHGLTHHVRIGYQYVIGEVEDRGVTSGKVEQLDARTLRGRVVGDEQYPLVARRPIRVCRDDPLAGRDDDVTVAAIDPTEDHFRFQITRDLERLAILVEAVVACEHDPFEIGRHPRMVHLAPGVRDDQRTVLAGDRAAVDREFVGRIFARRLANGERLVRRKRRGNCLHRHWRIGDAVRSKEPGARHHRIARSIDVVQDRKSGRENKEQDAATRSHSYFPHPMIDGGTSIASSFLRTSMAFNTVRSSLLRHIHHIAAAMSAPNTQSRRIRLPSPVPCPIPISRLRTYQLTAIGTVTKKTRKIALSAVSISNERRICMMRSRLRTMSEVAVASAAPRSSSCGMSRRLRTRFITAASAPFRASRACLPPRIRRTVAAPNETLTRWPKARIDRAAAPALNCGPKSPKMSRPFRRMTRKSGVAIRVARCTAARKVSRNSSRRCSEMRTGYIGAVDAAHADKTRSKTITICMQPR